MKSSSKLNEEKGTKLVVRNVERVYNFRMAEEKRNPKDPIVIGKILKKISLVFQS
jgi:hypothetical protein